MSDTPRDCEHGQLARSCRICELERELSAARAELSATKGCLLQAQRELTAADEQIAALRAEIERLTIDVYTTIRQHEMCKGRWNDEDELHYHAAIDAARKP